jgi:hypothetical protein
LRSTSQERLPSSDGGNHSGISSIAASPLIGKGSNIKPLPSSQNDGPLEENLQQLHLGGNINSKLNTTIGAQIPGLWNDSDPIHVDEKEVEIENHPADKYFPLLLSTPSVAPENAQVRDVSLNSCRSICSD